MNECVVSLEMSFDVVCGAVCVDCHQRKCSIYVCVCVYFHIQHERPFRTVHSIVDVVNGSWPQMRWYTRHDVMNARFLNCHIKHTLRDILTRKHWRGVLFFNWKWNLKKRKIRIDSKRECVSFVSRLNSSHFRFRPFFTNIELDEGMTDFSSLVRFPSFLSSRTEWNEKERFTFEESSFLLLL